MYLEKSSKRKGSPYLNPRSVLNIKFRAKSSKIHFKASYTNDLKSSKKFRLCADPCLKRAPNLKASTISISSLLYIKADLAH